MTAIFVCSLFRRTIRRAISIMAPISLSFFGMVIQAQDQPVGTKCPKNAKQFKRSDFSYCVDIKVSPACASTPQSRAVCEGELDEKMKLLEALVDVRIIARQMQASPIDSTDASRNLARMKRLIDALCAKNFCEHIPFSGFPVLTKPTRSSLLEFIDTAAARSIEVQASNDLDVHYSLRLKQMVRAIDMLDSLEITGR